MTEQPTRLIQLHGKHAVGAHCFVVVDATDFETLNQYRWKAKPGINGRFYALRNVKVNGCFTTVRLHREVLGRPVGGDVRFLNGDSLDCRRSNLQHVSRSQTTSGARSTKQFGQCHYCGTRFAYWRPGYTRRIYCSADCKRRAGLQRKHERRPLFQPVREHCNWCGEEYMKRKAVQRFCCTWCRDTAKNRARAKRRGSSASLNTRGHRVAFLA